jgi:hypothetical protein
MRAQWKGLVLSLSKDEALHCAASVKQLVKHPGRPLHR